MENAGEVIKKMMNSFEFVEEKKIKCIFCDKEYHESDTRENYEYWSSGKYFKPKKYCSLKCSKQDHENYKLRKRKEEHVKYALSMGVGKRHSTNTLQNFNGSEKDKIIKYLNVEQPENIIIQSQNTGNGKTHLAVGALKYYGQKNAGTHMFVNFTNLMMKIKSTFESDEVSESEIINKFSEYDLLVIDDIGADKVSDYNKQVLYLILNDRYEAMRPTITTTNLNGKEIEAAYGKRILSRLVSGHLIKLEGKDQRGIK